MFDVDVDKKKQQEEQKEQQEEEKGEKEQEQEEKQGLLCQLCRRHRNVLFCHTLILIHCIECN